MSNPSQTCMVGCSSELRNFWFLRHLNPTPVAPGIAIFVLGPCRYSAPRNDPTRPELRTTRPDQNLRCGLHELDPTRPAPFSCAFDQRVVDSLLRLPFVLFDLFACLFVDAFFTSTLFQYICVPSKVGALVLPRADPPMTPTPS